eukprot:8146906-Pyramimonas_sp.AAC.1
MGPAPPEAAAPLGRVLPCQALGGAGQLGGRARGLPGLALGHCLPRHGRRWQEANCAHLPADSALVGHARAHRQGMGGEAP